MRSRGCFPALAVALALAAPALSQTLNLPPRPATALTGSQFSNVILLMSQTDRENWVLNQVSLGNIPGWMRTLVPIVVSQTINGTPHSLTYFVTPDYLAVGSDTDYFLEPTTPILAQRLANLLQCTLPTRLMVNQIWTNSTVRMTANTVTPTNDNNATVPVFILQDSQVMAQRNTTTNAHPLGALVSGDKKDEIISPEIYGSFQNGVTNPVVIYGWIQPDGAPIQPEYNGHIESYMDYSHGVRLVQMAVILDGVTNSATNIMADPVLWPLLSDEGGPITRPWYTIDNQIAPAFMAQPFSQAAKLGANVIFTPSFVADAPVIFQWFLNNAAIPGATNATFSLTNVQGSSSGLYTVAISNAYGSATSIPASLQVSTNAYPLLFSDSLSALTSANWSFYAGSDDNIPDYTTNWAYNYGVTPYTFNGTTYVIPPAPNSIGGPTTCVRFTVNDSNGVDAAVNIYPGGQSFSGNFALKFDMWLNHPGGDLGSGGSGTTEYAICGINHLGTEINWDATNSPPATDGIWFGVDGDGGALSDYLAFIGNTTGQQIQLTDAASGLVSSNHTSAAYQALFPASRFETPGTPGKSWVAGEIDQSNGIVTWKMDGGVIAQRTNASSFTNGNIMLGYMDIFPSIASPLSDAYLLLANVRVENWNVPPYEPPFLSPLPANTYIFIGGTAAFSVSPGGSAPFSYQWYLNGLPIAGATNSSFHFVNVQSTNAGAYSVVASNVVGSVISSTAELAVIPPIQLGPAAMVVNGLFQFSFTGSIGALYTVQTSTDLMVWTTLTNLLDAANPVTFTDSNSAPQSRRFYRVLP